MPTVDLIVSVLWIGGLAAVILAQAVALYVRHRLATRRAESAARLADAIAFPPGGRDGMAAPRQSAASPAAAASRPEARAR